MANPPNFPPNILMLLICFPVAGGGAFLWCTGTLPLWVHCPAAVLTALLINSLAHDSLHGNVCEHRGLNDAVGWVCSFLAGLPRPLHARAHGLHHSAPMSSTDPHG
jgi:fatty acid desaturase